MHHHSKRCHTMITLRDATRTKAASMPSSSLYVAAVAAVKLVTVKLSVKLLSTSLPNSQNCVFFFIQSSAHKRSALQKWMHRHSKRCHTMITLRDATRTKAASMPSSSLYVAAVAAVKLVSDVAAVKLVSSVASVELVSVCSCVQCRCCA
ncbi:hypothetical protein Peur_002689 [Populus x canadensis]